MIQCRYTHPLLSHHHGLKKMSLIRSKEEAHIMKHLTILILILLLAPITCEKNPADDGGDPPANTTPLGVALSPRGFPEDWAGLADFFTEIGGWDDGFVMWNGAWREDAVNGSDAGEIPGGAKMIFDNTATYGYTPVPVFAWRSGTTLHLKVPQDPANNWTNAAAKQLFRDMLIAFAQAYTPEFLFFGNENSAYFAQDSADYKRWIDFYNDSYDTLKAVSPVTKIGTVFNFEHLSGSGALNGWTTAHWRALTLHDLNKIDILGITLYPWLHHAQPEDIPTTYMDGLFTRIGNLPVAVTETGWPSENPAGLNLPWDISEQAQTDFVPKVEAIFANREYAFFNWLFLYPLVDSGGQSVEYQLFSSISLRSSGGAKRPVYDRWLGLILSE
jgi:hypothetical protein